VSRVWPLETLARKRGVNELAAYLRMLGDHRTCSLLYHLPLRWWRESIACFTGGAACAIIGSVAMPTLAQTARAGQAVLPARSPGRSWARPPPDPGRT